MPPWNTLNMFICGVFCSCCVKLVGVCYTDITWGHRYQLWWSLMWEKSFNIRKKWLPLAPKHNKARAAFITNHFPETFIQCCSGSKANSRKCTIETLGMRWEYAVAGDHTHTNRFTARIWFFLTSQPAGMFLWAGRKPENAEKTHTVMGRTCMLFPHRQ